MTRAIATPIHLAPYCLKKSFPFSIQQLCGVHKESYMTIVYLSLRKVYLSRAVPGAQQRELEALDLYLSYEIIIRSEEGPFQAVRSAESGRGKKRIVPRPTLSIQFPA